jgi:hypothetical protein
VVGRSEPDVRSKQPFLATPLTLSPSKRREGRVKGGGNRKHAAPNLKELP